MKRRKLKTLWLGTTSCIAFFAGMQSVSVFPAMTAADAPDTVRLDSLQQYYEPVEFNHKVHTDMSAGDCTVCHHHTTGQPPTTKLCLHCHNGQKSVSTVSCRDCHSAKPFDASVMQEQQKDLTRYHIDKPGLKVAYHITCVGCHQTTGGPIGCQDCHGMTEIGKKLFDIKK